MKIYIYVIKEFIIPRPGKTTAIRRIAVRETGVFRPPGGPIEDTPETTRTSQHYCLEGFQGAMNLAPQDIERRQEILKHCFPHIYVCEEKSAILINGLSHLRICRPPPSEVVETL